MEKWRKIESVDGVYSISNEGRVRNNRTGHILALNKTTSGYLAVHLYIEGTRTIRTVHRLVAEAFLPPSDAPIVNHKDSNRHNNRDDNLEWTTHSGNVQHMLIAGRNNPPRMPVVGVSQVDGTEVRFLCQRDAEIALSRQKKQSGAINHCFAGKKKSAYGYWWSMA